jgi:hypothetical protein
MSKFRRKPVEVEARQLTNDFGLNQSIVEWCGGERVGIGPVAIIINTLEGRMAAGRNDWIIRGVQGEFYPCKPDIFAALYEPVE